MALKCLLNRCVGLMEWGKGKCFAKLGSCSTLFLAERFMSRSNGKHRKSSRNAVYHDV